jgi:hypothetical protein
VAHERHHPVARRSSSDETDPSLLRARDFCYSTGRAVVVVEGATHANFVTGVSTMLALGIVLNIIGLGFFCWVLITLAIYALPFFVGVSVGLYTRDAGTGTLGAIGAGIVTTAFALVIGRSSHLFARRSCASRSR